MQLMVNILGVGFVVTLLLFRCRFRIFGDDGDCLSIRSDRERADVNCLRFLLG